MQGKAADLLVHESCGVQWNVGIGKQHEIHVPGVEQCGTK